MKIIPREAGKLSQKFIFSEKQKHLIFGSLLGDASLVATGGGNKFRFQVEHCAKQKDYVLWKYKILKNFVKTPPNYQAKNNSWRFRTLALTPFQKIRKIFYSCGKKSPPVKIEDFIYHPEILAIWYMDDGNLRREYGKIYGCMLNTQSFSIDDNKRLKDFLGKRYHLKCELQRNHNKYRLYFGASSWKNFCALIAKYVIPTMRYKLS